MGSPARRHFERVSSAQRQSAAPAVRADANAYELMLAQLTEDKRRLHDIQSFDRRAEVKRELLPKYGAWVEGALQGDQGVQDDVLMTVMVWCVDVGTFDGALKIAAYAIKHKLAMPDQYKRSTGCLIAEECADYALRQKDGISADMTECLLQAEKLTATEDMPDEVRAKLLKAIGYGLDQQEDRVEAIEYLRRALALHDKVGVKKDIDRLERDIKNSAHPPGSPGEG